MDITTMVSGILATQDESKQLLIATTVLRSSAKQMRRKSRPRRIWPSRPRPPILAPASAAISTLPPNLSKFLACNRANSRLAGP